MLGVKYNFTSFNNNNYANNGGGSSTMKKKYASKFNKISCNSNFSINGNGYHSYIGNPNTNFTHDPFSNSSNILLCKTNDNKIKTSVKNTKGLINYKLHESPVNSFKCYQIVNKELEEKYKKDISELDLKSCNISCCNVLNKAGINKHFNNKDSSSLTEQTKTKCFVDRSKYKEQIKEKDEQKHEQNNKVDCIKKCNITKDLKQVNAFVPSYDIYMLKKKKCCNYNPRDEFIKGKEATTSIKNSYPLCY